MLNYIRLLPLLLFLCALSSPVSAQDISLSWEPSPSDNIEGYKVYYSLKNVDSFPLEGYDAKEGESPIDVKDSLSTKITGLDNDGVYYFSVTAYDTDGNESSYSNTVSSGWTPALYEPADTSRDVYSPFVFSWEEAPTGYDVSYILFYGTNKDSVTNATLMPPPATKKPPQGKQPTNQINLSLALLIAAIALLGVLTLKKHRPKIKVACGVVAFAALLTACTGGSSSSGGGSSQTVSGSVVPADPLVSIDMETSTSYQTTSLLSGATYYWKVVAVDEVNTTLEYQSRVYSFTTTD